MSISRERFDAVPRRRGRYILLYLVIMSIWAVLTTGQMLALFELQKQSVPAADSGVNTGPADEDRVVSAGTEPGEEGDPAVASQNEPSGRVQVPLSTFEPRVAISLYLCQLVFVAFFVVDFVSVFRTMGYPVVMIAAASIAVGLFPLPGLLVVAFLDRRVSKAWRNANDALGEG